ncbi:hypothetical protein [Loigolactobacillus coryniformis]|uniref:hypothetical protein n=1 Tax=Loigolactobacillus coryniformis TaxID=1610 RepID=UPI00345DBC2B
MQLYVLDRAKNTLATTASFYNDKHHKELTAGASIFEFTINKSDAAAQYMTTGNYLVFLDDRGRAWSFTILSYDETQTTKTVAAEDVSIELLNKAMDVWNTDQAYPFSYYFDLVTKGTPWKLGVNQLTDLSRKLVYTGRDTGLGRLLSVLKGFDNAECQFNIRVQQNKPVEFVVDVYKSIGTMQDNIQIVYNNELADIKKTESRAQFVTALAGIGGLVENQATTDPGLEKHIDFTDIDYKDDNFVSPKGDKFLRAVTANKTFNPGTTTYIEDFYDYDTQSAQELLNRTLTQLKERSEPQYTYNADVKVIDPTLDIGDTVTIIDHDYNPALYLQARVATLDKSYTDPTQGAITFCNYRVLNSNLSDQLRAMQNIIDQLPTSESVKLINSNIIKIIATNEELKKQVALSFESANGKSRIWFSKSATAQDGDVAFIKNADGATEIWKFVEGAWKLDTGLATFDDVKKAASAAADAGSQAVIAGQQASAAGADAKSAGDFAASAASQSTIETAAAQSAANSAVDQANLAVSQAGFANDAADQAKTAAANAQADAANALGQASTAKADAATALNDATTAKADANTAKANATQAIDDAATAKGQAANALGQAGIAIGNASTALNKINSMSVGGRNYLLNSATFSPGWSKNLPANAEIFELITEAGVDNKVLHIKNSFGPSPIGLYHTPAHKFLIGEIITQSILVRGHGQVRLNFNGMLKTFTIDSDTYTKIYVTGNVANGAAFTVYVNDIGEIWCHSPKVETGSLATDWSAAPEDIQQQFTDINGELSQKVSQTTYNVLAGTVDTVNTLAKQNQSTIGTLATKTSVDTVNKTATTAQTLAQQNANELLNKASTNTVDTLTQRVTTAESTLSQTATKAELALTQNDVNDLDDTVNKQATQLALTATKAELQVAQTNVDNLKKTVTSNTAGMTANANALKLKADSSTVSDLDGRVTSLSGQLDVQSDLISAKVTASDVTGMLGNYATQSWSQGQISAAKNEISASVETVKNTVDNWQVGGRNYILNSDQTFIINGDTDHFRVIEYHLTPGTWTFSANALYTRGTDAKVFIAVGDVNKTMTSSVQQNIINGRVVWTFKAGETDVLLWIYATGGYKYVDTVGKTLELTHYKLEQGNMATDWTPAPEDQATVDWTKSQLDIKDGKISAAVTSLKSDIATATAGMATTTWTNTQIDAAKTAINLSVEQSITTTENTLNNNIANATNDMATKTWTKGQLDLTDSSLTTQISSVKDGLTKQYTQLQQTLDGVQVTANNAVTQGQLTLLSNQFTSTISGIQVGGRNYIKNSDETITINGDTAHYKSMYTNLTAEYWTYSAEVKYVRGSDTSVYLAIYSADTKMGYNTVSVPIVNGKISWTFKPNNPAGVQLVMYASSGVASSGAWWATTGKTLEVSKQKLEKGNQATDWSAAPEDVQSQFTQLQNDINLRVKTGDLVSQIDVNVKGILLDGTNTYITNTTHIDTGVIKAAMIADAAIDSAKIANAAIDNAKIANASITAAKIADLAVGSAQIADGAISSAKIGNAAITSAKIADASIIDAKIVSLDGSKIVAHSITADQLDVNAIAVGLNTYGAGWQITPASIAFLPAGAKNTTIALSGDMGITYGDFTTGEILGHTYGTPYRMNAGKDWFNGISTELKYNGADFWAVLTEESDSTVRPRLTYSRRRIAELGVYEGWTFDASINATYDLNVRGDLSAGALHSTDSGNGVWLKRGTVGGHAGFGFFNASQQSGVYFTDDGTLYLGRAGRWYDLYDIVHKIGLA